MIPEAGIWQSKGILGSEIIQQQHSSTGQSVPAQILESYAHTAILTLLFFVSKECSTTSQLLLCPAVQHVSERTSHTPSQGQIRIPAAAGIIVRRRRERGGGGEKIMKTGERE